MNTTNDERRVMHRYTVTSECGTCGAESYGTWLAYRPLTVSAECVECGGRIELVGTEKACD